jgi:tetratricopeptide (TPR) repeat protein
MRSLLPTLALIGLTLASAKAAEPIKVEAGRGRNWTAIKLQNEGESLMQKGDLEGARRSLDAAIRSDPTLWPAFVNRAEVFLRQHKWDLAIQDCNEVLRQKRTFPEAALLRATANAGAGRYAVASNEINHVVSISRPRLDTYARALRARAWFYSTCPDSSFRNVQQAIKDAQIACKITNWKHEGMIDTLAEAYAAAGDFDSAIRYAEQAIALGSASPNYAKELQRNLALFKQHHPPKMF